MPTTSLVGRDRELREQIERMQDRGLDATITVVGYPAAASAIGEST